MQIDIRLELQIDDVILCGHGQVYPAMPKEAIKTLRSQKLKKKLKN